MNPSPNLFLVGPTGAGKSLIGRQLAEHYDCAFVDLDQEIEQRTGVDINTIFDIEGESGFRQREAQYLDECSQRTDVVLATGAGAVLSPDNRRHLAGRGFVIWLQASVEQQLERLQHDHSRPLLAGGDREQRLRQMARQRDPLYGEIADLIVPHMDGGAPQICAHVIDMIDARWHRVAAT